MNYLIVLALLAPLCLAGTDQHKQAMIKENKTPKEAAPQFNDACDECKVIIERFNEAVKDPVKLEELKNLLNLMCETTSYARECKLIVGRLDVIIKELEPFLHDPTAVCKKLHMCGNARLQKVHRLAVVYAKKYLNRVEGVRDVLCEECQFAVAELKAVVEEKSTQEQLQEYLRNYVCKHLGQYQGTCDEIVEQFLPEFFQELEQFLQNSKQVCTDLGLCTGQSVLIQGQPLHPADNRRAGNSVNPKTYRIKSFYRMLNNLQTKNGHVHMACWECELGVDAILAALKTETVINGVGTDLRELVCNELPTDFHDGCEDFLGLYLGTVLSLTVDQVTASQLCNMLHLCDASKHRAVQRVPASEKAAVACESCKGITDFLRYEFNSDGFQSDLETGLQRHVCVNMPRSVQNLCENLIKTYVPLVLHKAVTLLNSETICKDELHMCTSALLQQINDE
jgi:saposin